MLPNLGQRQGIYYFEKESGRGEKEKYRLG
jgi:hypothetical protein